MQVPTVMTQVADVAGVHDLHIWTVTSDLISMSAHIEVTGERTWHEIMSDVTDVLRDRFGIAHVTLQPEEPTGAVDAFGACSIDTETGRAACTLALTVLRYPMRPTMATLPSPASLEALCIVTTGGMTGDLLSCLT